MSTLSTGQRPTVLSRREFERIRASVLPPVEDRKKEERKKYLKDKSNARLQNWPNTLEATRKKKESFIKDREERAEAVRQQTDKEEAEFRRANRLATINKANEQIYNNTDKMKMLRAQSQYAEVIYTRGFQQKDKIVEEEKEVVEEAKYHQKILEFVKAGDLEDERKAKLKQDAIEQIKQSRREQLEEVRKIREFEKQRDFEEGEKMKNEAKRRLEEAVREAEEKERIRIENNYKTLEQTKRDVIKKKEMIEAQKAEVEARDSEVWKIDKRKKDIADRKAEMFDEAQETRMKMIDRAVEHLKRQQSKDNTLLNKQVAEQRAKEDKAHFDKEEKIRLEMEKTVASRTAQVNRKAAEKAKDKEIDDFLAAKWKKENEDGIQEELDKQQRAKDEQTRIKLIQYEEGKKRNREKDLYKAADVEQTKFLEGLRDDDDKRFTELCKAEIERNVKQGKPVYTLLKALEFTQPPLLAAKTVKKIREKKTD